LSRTGGIAPLNSGKRRGKSVKMERTDKLRIVDEKGQPDGEDYLLIAAKNMAFKIFEPGMTEGSTLESVSNVLRFGDQILEYFESKEPLAEPLDCKAGCYYCCFNQVWLTPPEALLIAHYVDKTYPDKEKEALMERIRKTLERTEGRSVEERARTRHDTPCILLTSGECSVYDVRPFICRALHALNSEKCRKAFESNSTMAEFEGYSHRYDVYQTVKAGLRQVCTDMGCQMDILSLANAMKQCLEGRGLCEAWVRGDRAFSP
jgi:Fe-S-cluster containining protein